MLASLIVVSRYAYAIPPAIAPITTNTPRMIRIVFLIEASLSITGICSRRRARPTVKAEHRQQTNCREVPRSGYASLMNPVLSLTNRRCEQLPAYRGVGGPRGGSGCERRPRNPPASAPPWSGGRTRNPSKILRRICYGRSSERYCRLFHRPAARANLLPVDFAAHREAV